MKGADDYCRIFKKAEQVGRLYILPGSHARGDTFSVFMLPKNEVVVENGGINPPLNHGTVEVYGVVSGQLGWTETYGWLHTGKWVKDFKSLVKERLCIIDEEYNKQLVFKESRVIDETERINKLLAGY